MRNHEVTTEQFLLNDQGEIAEPGWARKQVWTYRRDRIQAPRMRIKEWDYYLVIHDGKPYRDRSFAAALTISDDGYVGLQSCSMLFPDLTLFFPHLRASVSRFSQIPIKSF